MTRHPYSPYATADPAHRHMMYAEVNVCAPIPGELCLTWCGRTAVTPEDYPSPTGREPDEWPAAAVFTTTCPTCQAALAEGTPRGIGTGGTCDYCHGPAEHGAICVRCRIQLHHVWRRNPEATPVLPAAADLIRARGAETGVEAAAEAAAGLLRRRSAQGVRTYGSPLTTFNGRDAERDALEEAADLLMYLVQRHLETQVTSYGEPPACAECGAHAELIVSTPATADTPRVDRMLCPECAGRIPADAGARRWRIGTEVPV